MKILFSSIQLLACVSGGNNKTEEAQKPMIIQEFFESRKEVKDIIPSGKDPTGSTTTPTPTSIDSLSYLQPKILEERYYNFYEDDIDTAETAEVSVRVGFYPQHASQGDFNHYDYGYGAEQRDYEHNSGGYSDHSNGGYSDNGGFSDHGSGGYSDSGGFSDHSSGGYGDHGGSYGGGHNSGHKVKPRKPGPYGYPTPNFKCEKSSETLYVTKTELTFDKKCFNVFKVKCTEGYDEGKVRYVGQHD